MLRVDGTDQSHVDLADPTRIAFDYLQRMADLVDLMAQPGDRIRAVHVGGAGMTLPRYVAATRPRSAQVVLEPDAELTAWVRGQLPLPARSGIKVRAVEGRTGLAELAADAADLVVVDAFVGPRVPAHLTTVEFLSDVRRVAGQAGILLVNLTDRGPLDYARRVLVGARQAFEHVTLSAEPSTLKGRRFGNVILVASHAPLPTVELAQRAGSGPYPYRVLGPARIRQLLGGAVPFTDADSAPSPEPPSGRTAFG